MEHKSWRKALDFTVHWLKRLSEEKSYGLVGLKMSARSNFQLTFSISSRNQRACGGLFVGRRPTFFLLSPTLFLSRHVFAASPSRTKGCIPLPAPCAHFPTFATPTEFRLQKSARCENSLQRCSRSEGNTVLTRASSSKQHRGAHARAL